MRRVVGLIQSLISLVVRGVALVLVLYALVIGLSLVPQIRGNVPPLKQAAVTGLSWVQRAAQESVKLQASLNAPPHRSSTTTSQKAVPAQATSAQAVTVTSTPSGAIVVLDARQVGKTPLTIKVPPGLHRITVVQSGYASITRALTVRSVPVSLNVTLTSTR
ncbi:MAG TPA: PEGA domain-containing protein [bacterium]